MTAPEPRLLLLWLAFGSSEAVQGTGRHCRRPANHCAVSLSAPSCRERAGMEPAAGSAAGTRSKHQPWGGLLHRSQPALLPLPTLPATPAHSRHTGYFPALGMAADGWFLLLPGARNLLTSLPQTSAGLLSHYSHK